MKSIKLCVKNEKKNNRMLWVQVNIDGEKYVFVGLLTRLLGYLEECEKISRSEDKTISLSFDTLFESVPFDE